VYSSIQQQCLKQLGIPLYQLKQGMLVEAESPNEEIHNAEISDSFLTDLRIIFPNLIEESNKLILTTKLTWCYSKQGNVELADGILRAPHPNKLSPQQKRQIWQFVIHVE